MAKIRGPLCSVGASGTIGATVTFRQLRGQSVAQKPPVPTGPASNQQLQERQRLRDARNGWNSLDPLDQSDWADYAATIGASPWLAYSTEWQRQRIAAGKQPQIPAY